MDVFSALLTVVILITSSDSVDRAYQKQEFCSHRDSETGIQKQIPSNSL